MFCKKISVSPLIFLFLFLFQHEQSLWAAQARMAPADPIWESLEREASLVLARYPEGRPLPGVSTLDQAQFYLDAGLWLTAERLLKETQEREAKRLLLVFYGQRGEYEMIFSASREMPELFAGRPGLRIAAAQGALMQKAYGEALSLLRPIPSTSRFTPARLYLSALAYWGKGDRMAFVQTLEAGERWAEKYPVSLWSTRLALLNGYYHLSQKEYDSAFQQFGRIFGQDSFIDLAFLGLGWGYYQMNSLENLRSAFEGFEQAQAESPHLSLFFQMLSELRVAQGDLVGAIETGQRERGELHQQVEALEKRGQLIRTGEIGAVPLPPGSFLRKTLLQLEERTGSKKEIDALLRKIDLWGQGKRLSTLREEERRLKKEDERVEARIARRCLAIGVEQASVQKEEEISPLYVQAQQALESGRREEAEGYLKKLLNGGAAYAEESAFRLGDLSFERGAYSAAGSYYEFFLDRPKSYLFGWALYKSAWAYYLQGNYKKAIPLLFKQREALDRGGPCGGSEATKDRRENLRLLSLLLQREGGAGSLIHLTEGKNPQEKFSLFSELAQYYESTGQKKEMTQLVESWIAAYPLFVETPALHQAMIEAASKSNRDSASDLLTVRGSFVDRYRPGSPWAMENGLEVSKKIAPLIEKNLRAVIGHFHQEAKKADRVVLYQKTILWYQLYFQLFPSEGETGEVHFHYGELLSAMKDEKEAAKAYRASAYADPAHSLSAEAGYREAVTLEKVYSASDPNLWEGYARFIQGFPADPRVAQIYLKQAELAFEEGDYDKSRQFAEAISSADKKQTCPDAFSNCVAESHPQNSLAWAAQRLIAQGYLKEKDYAKSIEFLKGILSSKFTALSSKEIEEARSLLALSYYQRGETLKRAGRIADAANAYWEAYQGGSETELGPLALFEAASLWGSGSERKKSEDALQTFRQRYLQSALYHPALLHLARLYEDSNRPLEAATVYEEVAHLKIDSALSLQALGQAIGLYQRMEKWEKVLLLAGQTAQRSHGEKQIEGIVIEAEAQIKLGREKVAQRTLTDLIRNSRQKGPKQGSSESALYLAKAHLLLADLEIKPFEEIRLTAPLERNLQKKKALFDRLLLEYGEAATSSSPIVALAATHRIGEVLEEFSHALLKSERPKNLSSEERETYETLLKEQALPYLQRAKASYQRNIDWGKRAGLENEWVVRSAERLHLIQEQINSLRFVEEFKG